MTLVDLTGVPEAVLPVAEFSDHLHLGSGFSDDGSQDPALKAQLQAAMAAIEARTGKILIRRPFVWTLHRWREPDRQALPVAPVPLVNEVTITDAAGVATVVDPARYWLVQDALRPHIAASGTVLPQVPEGGVIEIRFDAGYGADWAGVPHDLKQAVLLLAAHYHEFRHDGAGEAGAIPFGVLSLIEHYRTVRVIGGAW